MKKILLFVLVTLFGFSNPMMAGHAPAPKSVEGAKTVSPEDAFKLWKDRKSNGLVIIDARGKATHDEGHIPGSVNLDVKSGQVTAESLAAAQPDKSKPLLVYCNGKFCGRSSATAKIALKAGYTNIKYFYEGYPGWEGKGYTTS